VVADGIPDARPREHQPPVGHGREGVLAQLDRLRLEEVVDQVIRHVHQVLPGRDVGRRVEGIELGLGRAAAREQRGEAGGGEGQAGVHASHHRIARRE
jgi:hypothetical protein